MIPKTFVLFDFFYLTKLAGSTCNDSSIRCIILSCIFEPKKFAFELPYRSHISIVDEITLLCAKFIRRMIIRIFFAHKNDISLSVLFSAVIKLITYFN